MTARNGRKQPPRRHAGAVHHDDFGIGGELVQDVGDRDHQRDRRDHQDQMRDDQAGDAEERQDGLALAGHQVDVAQRLGQPDDRRQADQHQQERPESGAKNVRPIDPIRMRRPTFGRQPARRIFVQRPCRRPSPDVAYAIDRSTKWLRMANPLNMRQQTVNADARQWRYCEMPAFATRAWCRRTGDLSGAGRNKNSDQFERNPMADARKLGFGPIRDAGQGRSDRVLQKKG